MAVPTISSVTPNTGHSGGGALVTIAGTNFRLPPDPPANGPSSGVVPQTVRITFGTIEAAPPVVWSATEMDVVTPIHDVGASSVTVTNLDDDGNPIAGETATLNNAFTFARPDLTAVNDFILLRVIRSLRRELARQVLENTVISTHVDFDPDTTDTTRTVEVATLPAIVLSDFDSTENRRWGQSRPGEVSLGGGVTGLQKAARFMDLELRVTAISDFAVELLALDSAIKTFFAKNLNLRVPDDMSQPNGAFVSYAMDYLAPERPASSLVPRTRGTNLGNAQGSVIIRGVPVIGMPVFTNEDLVARVYSIEEILLTVEKKE